ncbi:hypothetical protein C8J47_3693 [Sphingomonas sp. PP-F2F-G114-C0414]|nr:hypothetical protein C8J47_3693 [Sphingomonas sp. PP-F2F-G114-C0414]
MTEWSFYLYSAAINSRMLRFGYQFLGPFLLDWYNRLACATRGLPTDTIYMFGREGWNLVPLFNSIEAMRGGDRRRYLYLNTSRALLTHISLSNPQCADFGFEVNFEGTVRQFFESRLGLPFELLEAPDIGDQFVKLPRDGEYLKQIFNRRRVVVEGFSAKSRDLYERYLVRSGFDLSKQHIISDVGFRGTTQALLSAIYGFNIRGFYALLDPIAVPAAPPLALGAVAGLFSDTRSFGEGYAPLDRSLLLEALLTAPFGQIIGIQDVEHGDPFLYRAGSDAQRNFSIIGECFQGAHKFAIDNIDLLGSPEPLIEDFVQFFESYHAAIVSDADAFKPIFALDDSFFGTDINNAGLKL